MQDAIPISAYTLSSYTGYKKVTRNNVGCNSSLADNLSNFTGYKKVTRDNERCNHYLGIYSLKLHGLQKSNP